MVGLPLPLEQLPIESFDLLDHRGADSSFGLSSVVVFIVALAAELALENVPSLVYDLSVLLSLSFCRGFPRFII